MDIKNGDKNTIGPDLNEFWELIKNKYFALKNVLKREPFVQMMFKNVCQQ